MGAVGRQAVVLGGSVGGLLAARVLADSFARVTVIERDVLPDGAATRRGAPQAHHPHALLTKGAHILDRLFPGLLSALVDHGAPVWDDGDWSKLYMSIAGHVMLRHGLAAFDHNQMAMYFPSRPLLEAAIRRRVEAVDNVDIRDGTDVAELTVTADRRRVTGVTVTDGDGTASQDLEADLVVDAMGRSAHTPALLDRLGYGRPDELHVKSRICYVSQPLQLKHNSLHEMIVNIHPVPGRPTGMFLTINENDTAIFTVFSIGGNEPPTDLKAMIDYAEKYTPAEFFNAVRAAEPIGNPHRYRIPSSQWRRYDKMRRFPAGLLVSGDAICSFNPIYGQGMTVSALEAVALQDCLHKGLDNLAQRYFRSTAKPISTAWQLATTSDLNFPETEGARTAMTRIGAKLTERLLTVCETDAVVAAQFFKVSGLIDSPTGLLRPSIVRRLALPKWRHS